MIKLLRSKMSALRFVNVSKRKKPQMNTDRKNKTPALSFYYLHPLSVFICGSILFIAWRRSGPRTCPAPTNSSLLILLLGRMVVFREIGNFDIGRRAELAAAPFDREGVRGVGRPEIEGQEVDQRAVRGGRQIERDVLAARAQNDLEV